MIFNFLNTKQDKKREVIKGQGAISASTILSNTIKYQATLSAGKLKVNDVSF